MNSQQHELTIGKLAKTAGVNIETIRYYQRKGLIKEPIKPAFGFRKYAYKLVESILFIKRAQRLGFSLQEIGELLDLGTGHCRDVRLRAEKKRDKIETQIGDLVALRDTLNQLINECQSGENEQHCPIVESLLSPETKMVKQANQKNLISKYS